MINTDNIKVFNYINYIILACIFPIGYFAPLGEWLLISVIALSGIVKFLLYNYKIKLNKFYFPLIIIFLLLISYYSSINRDRSLEAMGSISGMVIAIYIAINISYKDILKNVAYIIGIPVFLTSLCIFSDIAFNTEIRSTLALLVGDNPTSESGNFSRGIIMLTMIMPLSVALFISNKEYIFAFIIFTLVSIVVVIGPNESSKVALMCSYFTALIVYFLGSKSFFYFGAVSLLWILFCPFIVIKVIPIIKNIDYAIEKTPTCERVINSALVHDLTYRYDGNSKLIIKNENTYEIYEVLKNGICFRMEPWQDTSTGGSVIHRLLVWEYVGKTIFNKPLIGHGIGTSRLIGQNIILNIPNSYSYIKGGIPLHPHSNFLQIWLELGLAGIILVLLLWINIIKLGMKVRKKSYILGTGVCASIVTIFVVCNLTFGIFQAWWMASIGLIFVLLLQAAKHEKIIKERL